MTSFGSSYGEVRKIEGSRRRDSTLSADQYHVTISRAIV